MTSGLDTQLSHSSPARIRRAPHRVAWATLAVVIGVGLGLLTYQVSLQPGAAMVRAVFDAGSEVTPPPDFKDRNQRVAETKRVPVTADGVPPATMNIVTPTAGGQPRAMILWIHGGGFISSTADTVRDYMVMLASDGYIAASLDYSLAPDAVYPAPVLQANAALAQLRRNADEYGGDPSRIFIGGDSAGAQIASELAAAQTNPVLAASLDMLPALTGTDLRGVILFCGLYDMRTVGASGFPALRTYLWAYTGTREWVDYPRIDELSTTGQATSAYPPTFLTVGDRDPFAAQAEELAMQLRDVSVPVTTLFWTGTGAGLDHEYQFNFTLPQAQVAYTSTLRFLNEKGGD